MRLLDCQVRLGGNINHVVPRYNVTDHEVIMLRDIHGNDAVVGIKLTKGEADRTDMEECVRLASIYGQEKVESLFRVKLDLDTVVVESPEEQTVEVVAGAPAQRKNVARDKGGDAAQAG